MSNQMWGGRFTSGPDAIMEEINASIGFDYRLARQDIAGSKAHVAMLAKTGIVSQADSDAIAKGLDEVAAEIESGKLVFSRALEDIHMNVESRLAELIGPVAGRLHTARSRNDQVAARFQALGPRHHRRARRPVARPAAGAGGKGRDICRGRHAGLHPSAIRAAGDLRPPSAWPMSR